MKELTQTEKDNIVNQLDKTGINFNNTDIELLYQGNFSSLKQNINLSDGSIRDAKIKLEIDDNGKIKLQYKFKEAEIVIPNKLGNKIFTQEEKEDLKNGKLVQCQYKGDNIYLQIDKELNSIVIRTQNQINLKNVKHFEMGGYVFNEIEKELLESGGKVPGVVMKGQEGYFVATIKLTDDKKGFVYENYKDITQEQRKEILINKNNKNEIETSTLSEKNINLKTDAALENTSSSQLMKENGSLDNKFDDKLKNYEEQLFLAVKNEDFKKVKSLSENKPPVSEAFIQKINNDQSISKEAKVAVKTVLKIEPTSLKNKLEENSKIKITTEKEKVNTKQKGLKRKVGKELIGKAFDDM